MEEDKGSEFPLTRRRSSARNLANVTTSALESIMVQVLKQAEFLRAKEEKRYVSANWPNHTLQLNCYLMQRQS